MQFNYDIIIIGGGPAGLTAGIYASRDRFSTLIIERGMFGGNIINTEEVENYPGFPEGISGYELTFKMQEQATKHGAQTLGADVLGVDFEDKVKKVKISDASLTARALVIASGTSRVKLGVEGEAEFSGRGVSYCATCDGPFFRDKKVAVVGGGNAALYEALHLSKFASSVTLIHRRDNFRATKAVQEKVFKESKINILWDSVVLKVEGEEKVKSLSIKNVKDNSIKPLEVDGVFVAIGLIPNTGFLNGQLKTDKLGSIITNEKMQTSVEGVFAAGDVRKESIMQVITAAGDGAQAAFHLRKYLE